MMESSDDGPIMGHSTAVRGYGACTGHSVVTPRRRLPSTSHSLSPSSPVGPSLYTGASVKDPKMAARMDGSGEDNNNTAASSPSGTSLGSNQVRLKQTLGLFNGVAMIVGVIVGSGIFVSPKGVLIESGSVGLALIIWTVSGFICLLGALCFSELGTMILSSGGMYSYIQEAFGGFPSFIYIWVSLIVTFPAANAVIALTCGFYILQPLFPCGAPDAAVRLIAAMAISLLTFVNCVSVRAATRVQDIFTVIKTLALIIIIVTGLVILAQDLQKHGKIENFQEPFMDSKFDPGSLALALYSGLFSYSGWYTLNFLTEELKNPYKNLPRAIWISMPLITIIYVLSNLAYFVVLAPREVIDSEAVAVTFAERKFGIMAWVMPIFVAFSTFGSLNGCIMSVSRLFFTGARDGHLPDVLALINIEKFTPVPALLFEGLASIAMLITSDVFLLINVVSFVESASFLVCTIALLYFRWKQPERKRPIRVNIILPIVFLLVCIFLVVVPMYTSPMDIAIGVGIMISGIPVYLIGVLWKKKPKSIRNAMARLTITSQKMMMGLAQEEDEHLD